MNKLYDFLWTQPTEEGMESFFNTHYVRYYNFLNQDNSIQALKEKETLELDYIDSGEFENSKNAKDKGNVEYREKDVIYTVNKNGCRVGTEGVSLEDEVDLMTFGCSFTYGVGIPKQVIWSDILANELNYTYQNFSLPGSSLSKITRVVYSVIHYKQPKVVVLLIPAYGREELITEPNNKTLDKFEIINYIPNYNPSNNYHAHYFNRFSKSSSILDQQRNAYKNLQLIKLILDSFKVQVYISSWDQETYEMIQQVFNSSTVLPPFTYYRHSPDTILARDGDHPGSLPNLNFAKNCLDKIKS